MSSLTEQNSQNEPFMAFSQDDITSRSLTEAVKELGWNEDRIFKGGIEVALQTLRDINTPKLLVIDLSGAIDPVDQIAELASVCDPGVHLVCIGTLNDVTLYRTLLDMGVEDYLLKPIDSETLAHTLERASEVKAEQPKAETEKVGEVVSIVGAIGGVGATSVALSFAWDMSSNKSKRVALVDLDLHFGTVALSMDLEPGKGFREALENPSRIDSLFLDRAMVRVNDHLSILASETDIGTICKFDSDALELLIERLRQKFDIVVLDVPRSMLPICGDVLTGLGKVLVVTDLSLTGMRDTLRISRYAKDHMAGDQLFLMANKVGENKDRELTLKEFEKGVDGSLKTAVPFDPKSFAKSEMEAAPLIKVAQRSKAAQAMKDVFDFLNADEANETQKPSLLRKLLGKT